MLKNYKLSEDAESDNRSRALYAMKFRRGGEAQWDDKMLSVRKEGNRPSESYNQIPQFLHSLTNDMRINMPQTRFIPGDDGDKEIADIYEEKARNIQASSEGEVAYDNAADSQATIGWGYWRYITEYENEKSFDQEIKIRWVPNTLAVFDDPNVLMQDYSDRKFLIEVFDMPDHEFNEYRDENDRYDSGMLESIGTQSPGWATNCTVRVAEYWELTHDKSFLYREKLKDGKFGEVTETKPKGDYEEREVLKPKVMWYKCTATEVLERKEWPGVYIPYVRVSGEMQIIDGKTYFSGLVEPMIPAQKQFNHWSNTATEIMGMVPLAPWIAAAGQIDPYKEIWDKSNVKKYPYLPYEPVDVGGNPLPPPQRSSASADVSGALALVNQAQQNFYNTTGIFPASLGKQGNETSGKAINARKVEGETSTFHFPDNMARALRFGGRILADLFPKVYDGSRKIRGKKEDGTTTEYDINKPFKDPKTGEMKEYDMTVGTYDVMVTTGPSFTTKRQESADAMLTLATSTNLMEVAPDKFYEAQDWPGAQEIADRYKKVLPPALTAEDDDSPIPPQITAQMEQMNAVIQQLQGQLGQAEQAIQSKEAEIQLKQADLQLKAQQMQFDEQDAQRQAQLDMEKIQLDREKLAVETLKIEIQGASDQVNNVPAGERTIEHQGEESENVLIARINDLKMKREQEAIDAQTMQQMQMQQQAMETERAQIALSQEANKQSQTEALMGTLSGIEQMLGGLIQSINTPKVVVRNPETGLVEGIQ